MSEQQAAPEAAPSLPSSVITGNSSLDARLAAASDVIVLEDDAPPAPVEPQADEQVEEATEAAASDDKPAERPKARGKGKPAEEPAEKPAEKPKARNYMRDLAAEWANARRAQTANAKRAAELEARAAEVEARSKEADEIAMYMQGHPTRAVERLAAKAGISPTEYLQRLQMAYINGEQPQAQPQRDTVAEELAQLRAELQAEKRARAEEQQRQIYEAQFAQVHKAETEQLVGLAQTYAEEFPALSHLSEPALQRQISDAVAWHLERGVEVGRFEVLQAANNVVRQTLDEYGLSGIVSARAASAPGANAQKSRTAQVTSRPRNGSGRYIPTNAAAAESTSGPRRTLTVEERLKEAEKVLWSKE